MSNVQLYHGDCLEVMKTLPDGSVDAVITDPPYAEKYSYIWEPFAEQSARVMKVGASLITLCGHYQVPFVIDKLSHHLRYWWILSMEHGNLNRLPGKWVCVKHKPALWYVKERRKPGDTECPLDSLAAGSEDEWREVRSHHKWGQPTKWFAHYIERLTLPNDVVLDPFMGSGTTGVACIQTGRNFIGIEIDKGYFNIAKQRIEKAEMIEKEGVDIPV